MHTNVFIASFVVVVVYCACTLAATGMWHFTAVFHFSLFTHKQTPPPPPPPPPPPTAELT